MIHAKKKENNKTEIYTRNFFFYLLLKDLVVFSNLQITKEMMTLKADELVMTSSFRCKRQKFEYVANTKHTFIRIV